MQKDQNDSGSRADKDSTLFLNGGKMRNPEERNGRSDTQTPGGQEDPSPEGRSGLPVGGRIDKPRQQGVLAYPHRAPLAGLYRKTRQKQQRCSIFDTLQLASNGAGSGQARMRAVRGQAKRIKDGYEAHCHLMYHWWRGKVKNAKDLLQKILILLRIFARKRVRPKVTRKAPGEPFPLAPKTRVPIMEAPRPRPRIVVDTNVIMGGLINPSKASGRIISIWLEGKVDVVVSPALLEEYLYIFNRMRFGPKEAVVKREEAMQKLLCHKNVALVQPAFKLEVVKEDPSDNRLIECAVSGRADFIISQDRHLLAIGEYSGIKILRAQAFLLQGYPEGRN